ncbi:MAG: alpha/beta fold hydrolase [Candidatus Pelagadaptatus aseana]|uniref:YheT family hydrolase n=1 Tax=Candidatus Pelagadaptatus aseana TaxID=3120508 RepID=UPI0039B15DFF
MSPNIIPMSDFTPPPGLRNPHVQNIIASTGPRRWLVRRQARSLLNHSEDVILNCGNGVRLLGHINRHPHGAKSLITLLHGWEGSSDSTYVLSAARRLYGEGHDIFRLNFRDHGDTEHLNREIFNSTRLSDVTGAMEDIQKRFHYEHYFLSGFSLGGNFTLRTTIAQHQHNYRIDRAVAICPVICPLDTMDALTNGPRIYERHFVNQWKRSLSNKTEHFPEYTYRDQLPDMKTLAHINDFFIPGYTPFDDCDSYFDAYSLKREQLSQIDIPTTIITSEDDPIVRHHMLPREKLSRHLSLEITRFGSHCAYLKNYRLHSWSDDRLSQLLTISP